MFMSNAGSIAYNMDFMVRSVTTEASCGAARQCKAGIATADPINVCGRLNFHTTRGNGKLRESREAVLVVGDDGVLETGSTLTGVISVIVGSLNSFADAEVETFKVSTFADEGHGLKGDDDCSTGGGEE